jgi:hypothetical protein
VATEQPQRIFTVAEANAALPMLAPRVERLQAIRREAKRLRDLLEVLWKRLEEGEAVLSVIGERQQALDALGQEFERLVDEVDATGVVLRDLDMGLVDFPARARGLPIFFCWRAGEAHVAYWHGPTEGYAGRKPISTVPERPGSQPN